MADAQIKITADTSQAERALGSLTTTLKGLATVASITALAKFSDSLAQMQNKLSMVTSAGQTSNDLFRVMAKSSLELGVAVGDVTDLYVRLAMNGKDLNLTQAETIRTTEILLKGFQMTGQSVEQARGSIIQLGQAFSLGVLRGDELNSVLEGLPTVAEALAKKFDVQRGALKVLGEQGRITSKDLYDAINESGAAMDKAWLQRIPTITESFNRLGTVTSLVAMDFDKQTNASQIMSYALLVVADAVISVSEWFQEWGKWILWVAEAFAIIYVPIRLARAAFVALIGPLETVIGWFRAGGTVVTAIGEAFLALADYITPITEPVTVLGHQIANLLGVLAAGASAIGLSVLAKNMNDLFGAEKSELADKYAQRLDKINKKLGMDGVEASNIKMEADKRRSTQEVSDQKKWETANQTRMEAWNSQIRLQAESIQLSQYQGDELIIQTELQKANNALIKEVKNDKGEIIGYTRGLSQVEAGILVTLTQQNELYKQQAALKAMKAPESTAATTSRAVNIFGGTQGGLEVEAARQQVAVDLLRNQGIINEREYADQSIVIERNKIDALIALDEKLMSARLKSAGVANDAITKSVTDQMASIRLASQGGIAGMQGVLGIMDNVASSMGTYNKQAFESHKKMATAMAIISTYQSIVTTMATVPFPFNIALAAAAGAAGFAQVAAIQGQQYSGRALGGPVQSGTSYIVGERGPEMFTPSSSGNITRNDQLGGSNVTVNFTIQANDTAGFDGLLNSRKGMIKQLITDAMLEKGQRF